MLMDSPNHGSTHRSAQGMPRLILKIYGQCEIALPDDDFIGFDFNCLGTQVGGKAVLVNQSQPPAMPGAKKKASSEG